MNAHQLTPQQRDALEWIVREALDAAWDRDLAPQDALIEAGGLILAAELTGSEELATSASELRDVAQKRLAAAPKGQPYTVLVLSLDGDAALISHVTARDPRAAYLAALEELNRDTLDEGEVYDPDQAERDRPLLRVFEGHISSVS